MNIIRGYVDKESDADKVVKLNKKIRSMREVEVEHIERIKQLEKDLAEKTAIVIRDESRYAVYRNETRRVAELEKELYSAAVEKRELEDKIAKLTERLYEHPEERLKDEEEARKKKVDEENEKHWVELQKVQKLITLQNEAASYSDSDTYSTIDDYRLLKIDY